MAQSQAAPAPATAKPDSSLLFQPLRLTVDSTLMPWVAAFEEKDHPELGRLSLAAAEDAGSRSGQAQAQGDYSLFGRDFTLLVTQLPAGAWNGLPLWMSELVFHFAKPADRKRTESTFVVGVVGRSNVPAAPLFSYRLAW
jgi:hypothetical protein